MRKTLARFRFGTAGEDAGFTLIEYVVTIGILFVFGLATIVVLNRSHVRLANTRQALLAAVAETRLHAANTTASSNGAMLVIQPAGSGSSLTILEGRPIPGLAAPSTMNLPPVYTDGKITVGTGQLTSATLAFAPSGQIDVIPQALQAGAGAIQTPPGCASAGSTTVGLTISVDGQTESHQIDCAVGAIH